MRAPILALTLLAAAPPALAQEVLAARLQDVDVQADIDIRLREILVAEANYTTTVQPELFRIGFDDAACAEFYDEMGDVTVGTCLITASGWQMYGVFALNFGAFADAVPQIVPLTIVIE